MNSSWIKLFLPIQESMKNIINLAGELHIKTVTEGVECASQADFIRSIHCDIGQGYYYAKPMPEDEFTRFITGKA